MRYPRYYPSIEVAETLRHQQRTVLVPETPETEAAWILTRLRAGEPGMGGSRLHALYWGLGAVQTVNEGLAKAGTDAEWDPSGSFSGFMAVALRDHGDPPELDPSEATRAINRVEAGIADFLYRPLKQAIAMWLLSRGVAQEAEEARETAKLKRNDVLDMLLAVVYDMRDLKESITKIRDNAENAQIDQPVRGARRSSVTIPDYPMSSEAITRLEGVLGFGLDPSGDIVKEFADARDRRHDAWAAEYERERNLRIARKAYRAPYRTNDPTREE